MNNLQIFNNEEFGMIRTLMIDGVPYFVGKDVAEALGYSNASKAVMAHVEDEDKRFEMLTVADSQNGNLPMGQSRTALITESGIYSLIFRSKLPAARRFKKWVTTEVLPSIRKHGMYAIDDILENPDLAIAALTKLKREREKRKELECLTLVQQQQIAEMKPKASYYDLILQSKNALPITQIAKDYGMSGRAFNKLLYDKGVQYKNGNIWLLYQRYAKCGYTQTKTHYVAEDRSVMHTYWTQKGRLFIYDLLKQDGVLPLMERGGENGR